MTMENVLRFIRQGIDDSTLRKSLNTAASEMEVHTILADDCLEFSPQDFDQAFHSRLVKCREQEEADQLKEFKMWWDLLTLYLKSMEHEPCGMGCNP